MEKLVVGCWYLEGSDRLRFTIYDDGTVNIPGTYGTGKWSIVNDNQLKISDFYGESTVLKSEDTAYLDALNTAIEELRADGTLKTLSEKYFGQDISSEN